MTPVRHITIFYKTLEGSHTSFFACPAGIPRGDFFYGKSGLKLDLKILKPVQSIAVYNGFMRVLSMQKGDKQVPVYSPHLL